MTANAPAEIRRIGPADIDIAARIAERFLDRQSIPADHFESLLEDERNVVIAALSPDEIDSPIGFLVAHCFPSLSGEQLIYLYDIEVVAGEKRRGVARAMVEELKRIAAANGASSIWVGSSLTNLAACALWEATGGKRVSDQYVEFSFDLAPDNQSE